MTTFVEVRNSYRQDLRVWAGDSFEETVSEHKDYLKGHAWNVAENELSDEEVEEYDGDEEKALESTYEGILDTFTSETTYKELNYEDIKLFTINWLENNQMLGNFDDTDEEHMDFNLLNKEDIEWYFENWAIEHYEETRY